jgi:hypothetical protein
VVGRAPRAEVRLAQNAHLSSWSAGDVGGAGAQSSIGRLAVAATPHRRVLRLVDADDEPEEHCCRDEEEEGGGA